MLSRLVTAGVDKPVVKMTMSRVILNHHSSTTQVARYSCRALLQVYQAYRYGVWTLHHFQQANLHWLGSVLVHCSMGMEQPKIALPRQGQSPDHHSNAIVALSDCLEVFLTASISLFSGRCSDVNTFCAVASGCGVGEPLCKVSRKAILYKE